MKNQNISTNTSLSALESISLLPDQDPELDFLDQLVVAEKTTPANTSTADHFISSTTVTSWASTQPLVTQTERSLELSECYLESIQSTLQLLSAGSVDHAPATLEVRQQLLRVQQELTQISSQHLSTPQRNQIRSIRLRLTQVQSQLGSQLARSERLELPSTIIPSALLAQTQMPRAFQRMAELRELCSNCHSSSEAWRLMEQLRVLETQIQRAAPQIIWRQGEETRVFNVIDLQEEIRSLRLDLMGRIRNR